MTAEHHTCEELDWEPIGSSDVDDIALCISPDVARLLLVCYPGVELRIPHKIKRTHHLVASLGFKNAEALCAFAPQETLHIPTKKKNTKPRNDRIRELVLAGVCRREVALDLGITQRHVRRLIAGLNLSWDYGTRKNPSKPVPIPPTNQNINSNTPLTGPTAPFERRPSQSSRVALAPPDRAVIGKYGYFLPQQKQVSS